MEHDILVLPNGNEGKRYRFEFDGRNGEKHRIEFVIDGKIKPSVFLEDLAKALKEYMGKYEPSS